jgi:hypothetical protein
MSREVDVVPGGSRSWPYYCLSRRDSKTRGEGRAAASFMRHVHPHVVGNHQPHPLLGEGHE